MICVRFWPPIVWAVELQEEQRLQGYTSRTNHSFWCNSINSVRRDRMLESVHVLDPNIYPLVHSSSSLHYYRPYFASQNYKT